MLLTRHQDRPWEGRVTALLRALNATVPHDVTHGRAWPKAANKLSEQLHRIERSLSAGGIAVTTEKRRDGTWVTVARVAVTHHESGGDADGEDLPPAYDSDWEAEQARLEVTVANILALSDDARRQLHEELLATDPQHPQYDHDWAAWRMAIARLEADVATIAGDGPAERRPA